eukprot:TRINITY_DN3533_c0_g1_i1.p1 TRINITY_DN3533_c0_g1~~TRINITY_DN3533_c0_g1_i1.p1  ORF type:complete len:360 (+),score=65.26 TRINITY_DN3533_c0_g1_i1:51-1130(+)
MNFSQAININKMNDDTELYGVRRRSSLRNFKDKKSSPNARSFTDEDKVEMVVRSIRRSKEGKRVRPVKRPVVQPEEDKSKFRDRNVVYPNVLKSSKETEKRLSFVDSESDESSCEIEVTIDTSIKKESAFRPDEIRNGIYREGRSRKKGPTYLSTEGLADLYINIDRKFAPHHFPCIGEKIGKFTVLAVLGKGSFGTVIKGQDDEGNLRAIKIVRRSLPFKNQAKEEAKMLQHLQAYGIKTNDMGRHFIVNIKGHFMHNDHFCIEFELLSWTLLNLIELTFSSEQKTPGLSLGMINKLSLQLLRCLSFLKRAKIIHCDIKPENVALVSPDRAHIKLLDFGSACNANEVKANVFRIIGFD